MDTAITYTNHLGASMTFGGNDEALKYLECGLRDYAWSYTPRNDRAASFRRQLREVPFTVGIAADDGETGIDLRNRLMDVTEPDVLSGTPGTMRIGEYRMACYVVGSKPTSYWMDDRFAEFELTLLAEDPRWVREIPYTFAPEPPGSGGGGLDYPFGFPFDLCREQMSRRVENDTGAPCPFLLRVFGPATDPGVGVGSNVYRVNRALRDGERLEIDSLARTVVSVGVDGTVDESAYGDREVGAEGSGAYVFEPVASGASAVHWDNTFTFDLLLYDVRSAPR